MQKVASRKGADTRQLDGQPVAHRGRHHEVRVVAARQPSDFRALNGGNAARGTESDTRAHTQGTLHNAPFPKPAPQPHIQLGATMRDRDRDRIDRQSGGKTVIFVMMLMALCRIPARAGSMEEGSSSNVGEGRRWSCKAQVSFQYTWRHRLTSI